MRTRKPFTLIALLLVAALTALTPLSAATEVTPTTAAKKKKKKSLKCKKGFVKKTIKKTVRKKGKKTTVKVKKCVKKKAPAKKQVPTPTPPAGPQPQTTFGNYAGTTSQGQAITLSKGNQGTVGAQTTVVVQCAAGAGGDPPAGAVSYQFTDAAVGPPIPSETQFTLSDRASAPQRPPMRVLIKGTFANGAATGTIDPEPESSQCPETGEVFTFRATKK